jgi:hypothetical protein
MSSDEESWLRWNEEVGPPPPPGTGSAMMVIRAWRESAGAGGLRARIWRSTDTARDRQLHERYATSVEEVEQVFAEWLRLLRDDDWGSGRPWRQEE